MGRRAQDHIAPTPHETPVVVPEKMVWHPGWNFVREMVIVCAVPRAVPEVARTMAHERWARRMDDAVQSAWLRGLRSQGPAKGTGTPRFMGKTPRAKQQLGKLDRTVVAGADR